jgi:hypothetical protein
MYTVLWRSSDNERAFVTGVTGRCDEIRSCAASISANVGRFDIDLRTYEKTGTKWHDRHKKRSQEYS